MRKSVFLPLLLVASLFLSGCGIIDRYFLPVPDDTVQEIFEAGNDAMQEKDYVAAAKYYSRIKDDYPFSPYAVEAELSLGDAYFLDKEYDRAAEAYRDFETLHPRHEAIPYVLYQLGMALQKGYISVDRPATQVEEALEYFHRLEQVYPDTEYAAKAEEQIRGLPQVAGPARGVYRRRVLEHEQLSGGLDPLRKRGQKLPRRGGCGGIRAQKGRSRLPALPGRHV